jgi:hypothetical protein
MLSPAGRDARAKRGSEGNAHRVPKPGDDEEARKVFSSLPARDYQINAANQRITK